MAIHEDEKRADQDLDLVEQRIEKARKSTSARSEVVDDLNSRLRELRRKNHFRLMLEEIFND
jgi:hypothetical protein